MSDVAEKATEIVADAAEEVAQGATHVAEVSRSVSSRILGAGLTGFLIGGALGVAGGWTYASRRLETKYSKIAAEEIAEMRQHYAAKAVALENTVDKPKLEEIVREQGYTSEPPMAVTPPEAVVDRASEEPPAPSVQLKPPVPVDPPSPVTRNVFEDAKVEDEWDWHRERSQRSPLRPYVIHIDEQQDRETYDTVTFTFYEGDDVLCNERDEVIAGSDRERIVGEANLDKFGHGSGDASIVYVRNDQLEMDMEVVKSPNTYAEEVHGFTPPSELRHSNRARGRSMFDDE